MGAILVEDEHPTADQDDTLYFLDITGNTSLWDAYQGYYVTTATFEDDSDPDGFTKVEATGKDVTVNVVDMSSLTLANGGQIGPVNLQGISSLIVMTEEGSSTTVVNGGITGTPADPEEDEDEPCYSEVDVLSDTTLLVNGDVNVSDVTVYGGTFISGTDEENDKLYDVTADEYFIVRQGGYVQTGSVTTNVMEVAGSSTADIGDINLAYFEFDVIGNPYYRPVSLEIYDGGQVIADTIKVNYDNINDDDDEEGVELGTEGKIYVGIGIGVTDDGENVYSTGELTVGSLYLNDGELIIGSAYGDKASVALIGNFAQDVTIGDGESESTETAASLDGTVLISPNGVAAVGEEIEDIDEVRDYLASLGLTDENGSLSSDNIGSILYLKDNLTIADGSQVILDAGSDYEAMQDKLTEDSNAYGSTNSIYLSANSAIITDTDVMYNKDKDDYSNALVSFDSDEATVYSDGAKVIVDLTGGFNVISDTLNVFENKDGESVKIAGLSDDSEGSLTVATANGLFSALLQGDDEDLDTTKVSLALDEGVWTSFASEMSSPVSDYIYQYAKGALHNEDGLTPAYNSFLNAALMAGRGSDIETVSRLGAYAGAAQAAMAANSASYEAIGARMGMSNQNAALTYADNPHGWASG